MLSEGLQRDAEERLLGRVGVGDDAAQEVVARARDVRQQSRDHPSGAGLRERERLSLLAQERPDRRRQILAVAAEDAGTEDLAEVALHRVEDLVGALRAHAGSAQVELDLSRRGEDRDGSFHFR